MLPDVYIWHQGQPVQAVAVLMVMHVAIALITYNALVNLAPVRALRRRLPAARLGAERGAQRDERCVRRLQRGGPAEGSARRDGVDLGHDIGARAPGTGGDVARDLLGRMAPAMTDATAGRDRSQPNARSSTPCPSPWARSSSAATAARRSSDSWLAAPSPMAARRVPCGRRLARPVLAAQQPAGQWEERQERGAVAVAPVQDAVLGLAVEDVVLVLHADETRGCQRAWPRRPRSSWSTLKFEQPNSRTLPSATSSTQRADRLGDGGLLVRHVLLVQVDAVGAEPGQAVLDGGADVGGRGAAVVALVGRAELGGQHDLVPPGAQRRPEVGLALTRPP